MGDVTFLLYETVQHSNIQIPKLFVKCRSLNIEWCQDCRDISLHVTLLILMTPYCLWIQLFLASVSCQPGIQFVESAVTQTIGQSNGGIR